MKTRSVGIRKTKPRPWFLYALGFYGLALVGLIGVFEKDGQKKIQAQSQDRTVALALDWVDVQAYAARESTRPSVLLDQLQDLPVHYLMVPDSLSDEREQDLRARGLSLIWRGDPSKDNRPTPVLNRLKPGDGLLAYGEWVWGYPRFLFDVASALKAKKAFIPWVEFAPQKGRVTLAERVFPAVIRTHCLQAKEGLVDQRFFWGPRWVRAVTHRWVRLLYGQMSPALTWEENRDLYASVVQTLQQKGYDVSKIRSFPTWPVSFRSGRLWLVSLLAVIGPLVGLGVALFLKTRSPFLTFLMSVGICFLTGVALHFCGSMPSAVVGWEQLRGIKLQLLLPLFLGLFLLITPQEIKAWLQRPVQWNHVMVGGGAVVLFFGFYLMRSGNFPLLPVPDWERQFRDGLEHVFGVRPRFKEFLLGYPLFILGLFAQLHHKKGASFWEDGRLFLWLGLVGPISLINTFVHFHTPFDMSVLRSFHGVWMGFFLSIPLCVLWSKKDRLFKRMGS